MSTLYSTLDRIKRADHSKSLYSEKASIALTNHDQGLADVDLRGKGIRLRWGMLVNGVPVSAPTGTLTVIDQVFRSQEGVLMCIVECEGITSLMARDKASKRWECGPDYTIADLVSQIVRGTLPPFSHCQGYTLVVHQRGSTYDTMKPGESFVIGLNESRLDVLRYLLEHTDMYMRTEPDDCIHIYRDTPVVYEYSLDGEHTFFTKDDMTRGVLPNGVYVQSVEKDEGGNPKYTGHAVDAASRALYRPYNWYEEVNVSSNDEAATVAASLLANIKASERMVEAVVPMNCYAEAYDRVRITDAREGTVREGHVGTLSRYFRPGYYRMELSFGGWFTSRKIRQFLKPYVGESAGGGGESFSYAAGMPATFSATRLNAAIQNPDPPWEWQYQGMLFGHPIVPAYGRLFMHAWNCYADSGSVKLEIYKWSGPVAGWELAWNSGGEGFQQFYPPELVYENPYANALPVRFRVVNPSTATIATHATGFISYEVRGPVEEGE